MVLAEVKDSEVRRNGADGFHLTLPISHLKVEVHIFVHYPVRLEKDIIIFLSSAP